MNKLMHLLALASFLSASQASAQQIPRDITLFLSSPMSVSVLLQGQPFENVQMLNELRIYFAPNGYIFVGGEAQTGVIIPPGQAQGTFTAPDGMHMTAEISGSASSLHIVIDGRKALGAAATVVPLQYLLRLTRSSCTVLKGRMDARIERQPAAPVTLAVTKGIQTCYVQPGRHLF